MPPLLVFLLFALVFNVEAVVELEVKSVCHGSLVHIGHLHAQVLRDSLQEVLSKLQKVVLLELLDFISAFDLVRVTAGLNREGIDNVEVAEDAETCTVLLVLLVTKLAVIVLKVG